MENNFLSADWNPSTEYFTMAEKQYLSTRGRSLLLGTIPIEMACAIYDVDVRGKPDAPQGISAAFAHSFGSSFEDGCNALKNGPIIVFPWMVALLGITIGFVLFLLFGFGTIKRKLARRGQHAPFILENDATRLTASVGDDQDVHLAFDVNDEPEMLHEHELLTSYRLPYEDVVFTDRYSFGNIKSMWKAVYNQKTVSVLMLSCADDTAIVATFHEKIACYCAMQHGSLTSLYGITYCVPNKVYLLLQQPTEKTLYSQLHKGSNLWDSRKHSIALQIVHALQYVHELNSLHHHSISSRNIFLSAQDKVKLRHPAF